jgi:ABC-type transport system substrate-binding protein
VAALRKAPNVTVSGPLPNRRIYMLAINHRRPNLDSAPLRRALALAIDRGKILQECFRPGLEEKVHQPLCGPYPSASWACPPRRIEDRDKADTLFNLNSARVALQAAKKQNLKFDLMFPEGDPAVARAMSLVSKMLGDLGIAIQLKPVSLRKLHEEVVGAHEYDLAYYWYDFPDPTFSILPLLDARSARLGGVGFLGYNGAGGKLESLCRDALNHRDFERVKNITHTIHQAFVQQEMPFVPLWQLDRHIAHGPGVHLLEGTRPLSLTGPAPEIDPLRVFATIEYWQVRGNK